MIKKGDRGDVQLKEIDLSQAIDPFDEGTKGWKKAKKYVGKIGIAEPSGVKDVWMVTFKDGVVGAFVGKELEFIERIEH